jgi:hypothetical protein
MKPALDPCTCCVRCRAVEASVAGLGSRGRSAVLHAAMPFADVAGDQTYFDLARFEAAARQLQVATVFVTLSRLRVPSGWPAAPLLTRTA